METIKIRIHKTKTSGIESSEIWAKNLIRKKQNPMYKPVAQFRTRLTPFTISQINKIRMMFESGHATVPQLAKLYKCKREIISKMVKYRSYLIDSREKSLIEMQNDGEILPDHGIQRLMETVQDSND